MSLAVVSLFAFSGIAKAQEVPDSLVNVAFGQTSKEDLMGGVCEVNVAELMKKDYHNYSLDGLQSLIGGYNGNIWGQAPLVLIDGVPRDASNVKASGFISSTHFMISSIQPFASFDFSLRNKVLLND